MKALLILALALPLACAGHRFPQPVYLSAVASIAPGLAADPDLLEIRGQYVAEAIAYAAQDSEAISRLRSEDYQAIYPDGSRYDAAQMREATRRFFVRNKPPFRIRFTMLSAERAGSDTVRVQVLKQASCYKPLAGKYRKDELGETERETWHPEGGIWKLLARDSIRFLNRWVDGKPVHPSKPFDPDAPPYVPGKDPGQK
jgi:hypothetical protein